MSALAEFHFLRPAWLALLPLALGIWWLIRRRHDALQGWRELVAPRLLPHLLVDARESGRKLQPVTLLLWFWLLGILALAGPAWQREASPFAAEQSVLVVILKTTPSMQAGDVQPSRMVRAVDKIQSLLALRPDTRAALIAYAGSAHRVLPFTRDHALLVDFAAELSPEIMPRPGDDLVAAITLGQQLIEKSERPGTMLVLADSVEPLQLPELEAARAEYGAVELWGIAAGPEVIPVPGSPPAPPLDEAIMRSAAKALGGSLELISLDDGDVEAVEGRLSRHMTELAGQEGERWRDAGYYLLPLLLVLGLFWFRKGWVVRWSD